MKLKGRNKEFGIKRFFASIKYSWDGLKYAYLNEQSMTLHLVLTIITIIVGILLKFSITEWLIMIVLLANIAAIELLNTAVEAVVDMVMPDIHPLAKIAKDTGSAAAFVISIGTGLVALFIIVPKLITLF